MLQIEQARVREQLKEAEQQYAVLKKINPSLSTVAVVAGSLVKTNNGYFFLSIAGSRAVIDGHEVIALSPQSPLGKLLLLLKEGQSVNFQQGSYTVENIE